MIAGMDIIDAYAHCGIRKYKPYEDLNRAMKLGGVVRTVLAEHRGEYDHSYILGVVQKEPSRFRGVFLVDFASASAVVDVTRWGTRKDRAFRGIRMPVETLGTHRAVWLWAAQLGLNFVVDGDLANAAPLLDRFAREMPKNAIQITHLGAMAKSVLTLAERPNIHLQISGMHQFGKLPYTAQRPWVEQLLRAFGDSRLLYASNFPVMREESVYLKEIELLKSGELGIPASSAQKVMHDNAARLWFRD